MGAGAARRARVWLLSLRTLIVKALLFDFDGVLWDSEAAAFQSWQETYGEYGQHLPLDAFATRLGTVGGIDLVAQLELLVGRPIDREAVAARRWDRKMQMVRQLQPRPGVLTYLHDAREHGLAVALVSTDDMEWITTGLQILDLLDAWDFIECAEGDQLRAKPSPALTSPPCIGSASARTRPSRSRTPRTAFEQRRLLVCSALASRTTSLASWT